jgi:hypothetical protein
MQVVLVGLLELRLELLLELRALGLEAGQPLVVVQASGARRNQGRVQRKTSP